MPKLVDVLLEGIFMSNSNSGQVGNNARAGGNIAGRDIKNINVFGGLFRKSQKSDILKVVMILDKKAKELYKVSEIKELNPRWQRKINYNDLNIWKKIFENTAFLLEKFESEIIPNLTIPDRLLKDLANKYARISGSAVTSGEKCEEIKQKLLDTVNQGSGYKIPTESKDEAVELTIYWAFTRCQIFENPPEREEK